METLIYNIDSNDRNKTSYPNSHDFTYNRVDKTFSKIVDAFDGDGNRIGTTTENIVSVEPFNVKNILEINVSSVEIPNTFYYISSTKGNNTITTVNDGDETIADGSYTKDELMTAVAALTGVSSATYSSTTGKVTLATGSNFSFTNISNYPSLGEILGYEDGTTYTSGTAATNAMTLPQEPYVFLKINDLGNIIHKDNRYVAKLVPDNSSRFDDLNRETVYRTLSTRIIFDQPNDMKQLGEKYVNFLDKGSGALVLTDIVGTTPSNIAASINHSKMRVVAGLNLSMILNIFNYPDESLDKLAKKALEGGVDGIMKL